LRGSFGRCGPSEQHPGLTEVASGPPTIPPTAQSVGGFGSRCRLDERDPLEATTGIEPVDRSNRTVEPDSEGRERGYPNAESSSESVGHREKSLLPAHG